MDIYAAMTRAHMRLFGTAEEQLAHVASQSDGHGVHNPKAHFRKAMTVEEVLAGRPLGYPLTVPMCSPITDGAAAAVVCNDAGLQRLASQTPIKVLASLVGSSVDRALDDYERHITPLLAKREYGQAGVGPADPDLAEGR